MRKFWTCIFLVIFNIFSFSSICFSLTDENINKESVENSEEKKTVYLTFDDGPGGKVTEEILDIMKEENVKGTFFLVGTLVEREPHLVKRMFEEGHGLGLHTYTHKGCKIYKDNDSFLQENLLTQKVIEGITGYKPTMVRFPFGCNNSYFKINNNMVESLHKEGIRIYDWNVDTTDGMNPKLSPSTIAEKAKSKRTHAVILMHCGHINRNSPKALPDIIKYYKSNGYEFKVLDETTPEIYKIKKRK